MNTLKVLATVLLRHLTVACLAMMAATSATATGVIAVQADQWCPYNCKPDSSEPGYVVELMQTAFSAPDESIAYTVLPWSRAIQNVRDGTADAVIGATIADAKSHGLKLGKEVVGISTDCLIVAADNPLKFKRASDLNNLGKVGVVSGYSYAGALGRWVDDSGNRQHIEVGHGEMPADINLKNLAAGRLGAVIENKAVAALALKRLGLTTKARFAGCTGNDAVYVAFSSKRPDAARLSKQLDDTIREMRLDGRLAKLLAKYGQQDWQ